MIVHTLPSSFTDIKILVDIFQINIFMIDINQFFCILLYMCLF